MFPEPIYIFGIPIHLFGLVAALSIGIGYWFTERELKEAKLDPMLLPDYSLAVMLPAILTARLFFVISHLELYNSSLGDALRFWEGGLVFSGGLLGGMIGAYSFCRIKKLSVGKVADATAPGLALGLAISRLGCWFAGCCYGRPSNLPWACAFNHPLTLAEPRGVPLHPAQLYALISGLVVFACVIVLKKKKTFNGEMMLFYLMSATAVRIILDLFRAAVQPSITLLALSLFLFLGVLYSQLKWKVNFEWRKNNMAQPRWRVLFLIAGVALFAACGIVKTDKISRGHNLLQGDVDTLVRGQSTERDVLKLFGPPTKIRDTDDGQEMLYEYSKTGGFRWNLIVNIGGSSQTKTLLVWLDKAGVVTDYAYKTS